MGGSATEYSDIEIGGPPAEVFEIPAGFTKTAAPGH
jgi:hypothetical protein